MSVRNTLFGLVFAAAVAIGVSCEPPTPTPGPSPVPLPDVRDDVGPTEEVEYFAVNVHWGDPTVPEGFATVYCLNLPATYLEMGWKITGSDGFLLVSGAELVDLEPPTEIGTGIAAGPVPIRADIQGPAQVRVWVRLRWVLVDAECVDDQGQPITEIVPGVYVPALGEVTWQDAEGYWFAAERSIPAEPIDVYLPVIMKGSQ